MSKRRLDVCVLDPGGGRVAVMATPLDADGLRGLAREVSTRGGPVQAAIESMNGAQFVHDSLELLGWDVGSADAQKVKELEAPACTTDKI